MSAQRRGEGEGFDGRKKGFACALSSSPSHRWYPHGCPSCVSNCPHHSFPPPPLPPSPPTAAAAKQPSIQESGENRGREKKRKENGKKPSRKKTKGPFVVKKPSFDDRVWDLFPLPCFSSFCIQPTDTTHVSVRCAAAWYSHDTTKKTEDVFDSRRDSGEITDQILTRVLPAKKICFC